MRCPRVRITVNEQGQICGFLLYSGDSGEPVNLAIEKVRGVSPMDLSFGTGEWYSRVDVSSDPGPDGVAVRLTDEQQFEKETREKEQAAAADGNLVRLRRRSPSFLDLISVAHPNVPAAVPPDIAPDARERLKLEALSMIPDGATLDSVTLRTPEGDVPIRGRPVEAVPVETAETVIGCDVTGDRQTLVRLERQSDDSWKIVGVATLHRDPETGLFVGEANDPS